MQRLQVQLLDMQFRLGGKVQFLGGRIHRDLHLQQILRREHQQIAFGFVTPSRGRSGGCFAHPVLELGAGHGAAAHTTHRRGHVGVEPLQQVAQLDGLAEESLDGRLLKLQWLHRVEHIGHQGDGQLHRGGHLAKAVQQGPAVHAAGAQDRVQQGHIEVFARVHATQSFFAALHAH